jgi:hypothetical protein
LFSDNAGRRIIMPAKPKASTKPPSKGHTVDKYKALDKVHKQKVKAIKDVVPDKPEKAPRGYEYKQFLVKKAQKV